MSIPQGTIPNDGSNNSDVPRDRGPDLLPLTNAPGAGSICPGNGREVTALSVVATTGKAGTKTIGHASKHVSVQPYTMEVLHS